MLFCSSGLREALCWSWWMFAMIFFSQFLLEQTKIFQSVSEYINLLEAITRSHPEVNMYIRTLHMRPLYTAIIAIMMHFVTCSFGLFFHLLTHVYVSCVSWDLLILDILYIYIGVVRNNWITAENQQKQQNCNAKKWRIQEMMEKKKKK